MIKEVQNHINEKKQQIDQIIKQRQSNKNKMSNDYFTLNNSGTLIQDNHQSILSNLSYSKQIDKENQDLFILQQNKKMFTQEFQNEFDKFSMEGTKTTNQQNGIFRVSQTLSQNNTNKQNLQSNNQSYQQQNSSTVSSAARGKKVMNGHHSVISNQFQKVNDVEGMAEENQFISTFNTEYPLSSDRYGHSTNRKTADYQKIFIPVIIEQKMNTSNIKAGSFIVDLYKIESQEVTSDIFSIYTGTSLLDESKNEKVTIKIYEPSNQGFNLGLKEINNYLHLYEYKLHFHESGIVKMRDFFYFRNKLVVVTDHIGHNILKINKRYLSLSSIKTICISDFEQSQQIENTYTCMFDCFEYADVRYQAPEIILGIEYTSKSDVWSLGCIMYELLTGEVLFKTQDKKEIIFIIKKVFEYEEDYCGDDSILNNKYIESFQALVMNEQNNISGDISIMSQTNIASKKIVKLFYRCIFIKLFLRYQNQHEINEKILEIKQNLNLLKDSSLLYDFLRFILSPNPELRPTIDEVLEHIWIQDR